MHSRVIKRAMTESYDARRDIFTFFFFYFVLHFYLIIKIHKYKTKKKKKRNNFGVRYRVKARGSLPSLGVAAIEVISSQTHTNVQIYTLTHTHKRPVTIITLPGQRGRQNATGVDFILQCCCIYIQGVAKRSA